MGLRRALPGRLRVRARRADRLRDLPQPVQAAADRRQLLRLVRQLPAGADRPPVLGLGAPRLALPRGAGADHAGTRAARRTRARQRAAALDAAVPAVDLPALRRARGRRVPDVGVHVLRAVRPRRAAQQLPARRPARPAVQYLGSRVHRHRRHLGVRRLQHADLLLRAACVPRRPVRGRGDRRGGRAADRPVHQAARAAPGHGGGGGLLDHRQPAAVQRAQHPALARAQHDPPQLHAQHVRLQPVVRGPGVQLLGGDRHGHGRPHHDRRRRGAVVRQEADGMTTRTTHAARVARQRDRRKRNSVTLSILMTVMLLYALLPLLWLLVNSTKTEGSLFATFGLWFGGKFALWSNIHQVLTYDNGIFVRWLGNTLLYVIVGAGGATCLATLAGYGLAKYNFPGKRAVFAVVLGAVAIPGTALAVPTFLLFAHLHLTNTPWSVIVPSLVSPFGLYLIWVYAQDAVPAELLEAARIDGAGC